MKLQRVTIIDLTWLSDWVTSQSCRVLLCLAESSCNPTHNRFRWVRINWRYKIGGRNGCLFVFFTSKSDIDTFYQFTVALIVFKKKKKKILANPRLILLKDVFSQGAPDPNTLDTDVQFIWFGAQHILTTVPETTFSSGPGHGSWVPRQVLGRCGNNCAYARKWAAHGGCWSRKTSEMVVVCVPKKTDTVTEWQILQSFANQLFVLWFSYQDMQHRELNGYTRATVLVRACLLPHFLWATLESLRPPGGGRPGPSRRGHSLRNVPERGTGVFTLIK